MNRISQPNTTPSYEEKSGKETSSSLQETSRRAKKSAGAFRTISEVADSLGVQQHVLRFWETKFTQVKPLKRGGGRRYYRPEDVAILQRIHHLLYTEGYTIKGVQKLLKGQGKQQIIGSTSVEPANESSGAQVIVQQDKKVVMPADTAIKLTDRQRTILDAMLGDLKELRSMVKPQE